MICSIRPIIPPYSPAPESEAFKRVQWCQWAMVHWRLEAEHRFRVANREHGGEILDPQVMACTSSSTHVGDKRDCPQLHEVIRQAITADSELYGRVADLFVFTNPDVAIVSDAEQVIIEQRAAGHRAGFSRRVDVDQFGKLHLSANDIAGEDCYPGCDLFWFTADWWRDVHELIPKLYLGFEGWDFVVQAMITMTAPSLPVVLPPLVTHMRHAAAWQIDRASPGQCWNRARCAKWAADNGLGRSMGDVNHYPFLFAPLPEEWAEVDSGGPIRRRAVYRELASA